MQHLKGVGVALVTPFDDGLDIDYKGFKKLIKFVSQGGADYLVVNGTTGESPTTTVKEKQALLKFTKENNPKKLPIVFGLGGNDTHSLKYQLATTDLRGVEAILSVCPYYNKPSQAGIIAHFKVVADFSPVPVILYNVPGRTVVNMTTDTILELAKHPNIIGLKDACSTMEQYMEIAWKAPKDFLLLSGDDNLVVPMISLGWHGVISVIANAFPREFRDLTWHALEGRFAEAAALQFSFIEFDTLLYEESNPVGIKECLAIKGICGSEVRQPLLKASSELSGKFRSAMEREGFL